MQILIATRKYEIDCPQTGRAYRAADYMYRKPCGSFALKETSAMPGDREGETPYSLEGVFAWLREMPEQVERAVAVTDPI